MAHFKSLQLTGTSYEEAYATSPFVGEPHKNATQAWKNYLTKNPGLAITDSVKRQWMEEYLKKETKCNPGIGCYIVDVPAVKSDKKRPYKITNIKNDKGARKYKTALVGLDNATGEELFVCMGTKSDASEMIKDLIVNKGYTGKGSVKTRKVCVEGVETVMEFEYSPSKGSHPCTITAFGMVAD